MDKEKLDKLKKEYTERYKLICGVMDEAVNKWGSKRNEKIPSLFGVLNGYLREISNVEDGRIVYIKQVHAMRTIIEFTEGKDWKNKWFIGELERELRLLVEDMKDETRYNFNMIRFVLRYIEWSKGKEVYDGIKYWIRHYKKDDFVAEVLNIVDGNKSIEDVDNLVEYITG